MKNKCLKCNHIGADFIQKVDSPTEYIYAQSVVQAKLGG